MILYSNEIIDGEGGGVAKKTKKHKKKKKVLMGFAA